MFLPQKFILHKQTLWLSPARCIFWEEEKALILSDLHFGKSGHFRKSGIGVPQNVYKEDLQRLFTQIQFFKPVTLLIAGDMFHSHANKEIDFFLKWRNDMPSLEIHLIKGNHDVLSNKFYESANIRVTKQKLSIKNFCFTHDITSVCEDDDDKDMFTFSGHIHPGIKVTGSAKQSLKLPCFYFTDTYAVLPAFSIFTGLYKVTPKKADKVFALVENQVIKMQ
ncbi:MAG: ligase-associated DNA damage response endonuclease PdeM [Ginsengibacter sp.]